MSGQPPGEVAYEAFYDSVTKPGTYAAYGSELLDSLRPAWEATAAAVRKPLLAEIAGLRELLEEVGGMAANAPEDGDSFGLLEEIAMRIAAFGVPLDEAAR